MDRNQHRHAPHALSAQASLWVKIQLIRMFVKVSHGKAFCIEGADLHVKEQLKDLIVILVISEYTRFSGFALYSWSLDFVLLLPKAVRMAKGEDQS